MRVEQDSYKEPVVERIVKDVRAGIRCKADLEFCGCPICKAALKVLGDEQ